MQLSLDTDHSIASNIEQRCQWDVDSTTGNLYRFKMDFQVLVLAVPLLVLPPIVVELAFRQISSTAEPKL